MARYLIRLRNETMFTEKDAHGLATKIRGLLASREAIGNLRVSSRAIEFDLFAEDKKELEERLRLLEQQIAKSVTVKLLDKVPKPMEKKEVLMEGMELFNEERYWESHELLEQAWQPSRGVERDTVHGMILAAAALVHHQKDRDKVSLGMLERALAKLDGQEVYEGIDIGKLRADIRDILDKGKPVELTLRLISDSSS
jgi:hypothetical protein